MEPAGRVGLYVLDRPVAVEVPSGANAPADRPLRTSVERVLSRLRTGP